MLSFSITNTSPIIYQIPNTTWAPCTDGSSVNITSNQYHVELGTLGWNETAQGLESNSIRLIFTIDASGTEFIQLFALQTNTNTCIKGGDLTIDNVPSYTKINVIAFALSTDGNHLTNLWISNNSLL